MNPMNKMLQMVVAGGLLWLLAATASGAAPGTVDAPSRPGVDAPELAALGPHGVGVRTLMLVDRGQLDLSAIDPATGAAPLRDRSLKVELW
jgi:hypothetical protein